MALCVCVCVCSFREPGHRYRSEVIYLKVSEAVQNVTTQGCINKHGGVNQIKGDELIGTDESKGRQGQQEDPFDLWIIIHDDS